ncbi:DUF4435 domain-containing protein [Enterocloster clostridioformis]|uniref:AAA domain-containing protein, putative AbiEii toxin, Type IV TA system n=1 Tax=Enterocloster clostridioformis TaxID=1531 RepID=A0A1I0JN61_9FIRM|nr:DUF4435 domain-containing protein [Enterocloster clostridioformis]SEU11249.1 AAA domain-containing protein, putative AbiEii toxin, Type IV TA system [Enterocloster clostridioformis]SEW46796.1 AAA domain-containing protein, putative AbiEii toxin, Type IV TA system [Enterocloster clostridioformis]
MEYKYYLPDSNNQAKEYVTKNNSLIIIGGNGTGKSKLGEWMEKKQVISTHRIGAQRSLVFGHYIQQKSYEQAINLLMYGRQEKSQDHDSRWEYDGEKYNYTSSLLNDYENVLSALIALKTREQEQYISECKEREAGNLQHNKVPEMVIDILQRIWKSVFPQRNIKLDDAKVTAIFSKDGTVKEYKGRDMSDGERVALYLIAQALCVPENKTIIIDEPEIHLHRSIMNRLWVAIEKERQDCFFVYITHDTQFAANHAYADKIWVKGYDGEHWNLEKINDSDLPEELLLNLLGNRKPVLFVEGTADSYDTKLYSEIYKNYYVVPCGSCSRVIAQTKAMKANPQLHHLKCYGIIDRDYRSEYEIEKLEVDGIYALKVAEVENLFLVEELLNVVNTIMGFTDTLNVSKIKKYIIEKRFQPQINHQICDAVISEIKYQLSTANITGKKDDEVKQSLEATYSSIVFENVKAAKESLFTEVLHTNDYAQVLKIFNYKTMSKSVGHFFGLKDEEYHDFIIRQLNSTRADEIKTAIIGYLPTEISEE